jgi:hypothetical protein
MLPRGPRNDRSQIHFWAILAVTLLVMLLGILVVAFPEQMGVPRPPATPAVTEPAVASPGATP